ncbi:MAG: DNA-binding protein [Clostridiales bacterium GWC2_40_7]|nr:MAG: DNA-binding protein [Clostridiales bacterium GWC2_40_7]
MSQVVEKTGKTVQEAVNLALEELNASLDNTDIEVLDEGSKGLFGIGSKVAKVRVTLRNIQDSNQAERFLQDVFSKMNVSVDIDTQENEEALTLRITGKDSGIIIGRRGETLDALQYLTSLVVNKNREDYKRVTVDIENYRQKREETLVRLANRLAERVVRYRKNVTLEPMNPYERRIIHSSLQNNKMVETYSVGDEPNRKVVITIKQQAGYKR